MLRGTMMPNPMLILAVVVAFVLNGFYWNAHGSNAADVRWKAKVFEEMKNASESARRQESMWQGVVNGTAESYTKDIRRIRGNLDIALDSLRSRPERAAGVSDHPRAECTGANGPELARINAEFLERYAALAAGQDAALEACYKSYNAVAHPK